MDKKMKHEMETGFMWGLGFHKIRRPGFEGGPYSEDVFESPYSSGFHVWRIKWKRICNTTSNMKNHMGNQKKIGPLWAFHV